MPIYLDNNATTAIDPRVILAMSEEMLLSPANPSSIHSWGRSARQRLIGARQRIAAYFDRAPQEFTFTSGATEALNALLLGLDRSGGHVITSDIEHPALYNTVQRLRAETTFLTTGLWGAVTAEQVEQAIRPNTHLIALGAANSETGVMNPIVEIAEIARARKITFVVDGVALLGKEECPIHPGVSAMAFSGHKIHGPQGIGLIWTAPGLKVSPLLSGGHQELGRRAGTENLVAIVGLAKAIELLIPEDFARMRNLRDHFEEQLQGVVVNGQGPRVSNTSNLCFPGCDGEALLMSLDMAGIAASLGSACSSGAIEPSRVLRKMGCDARSSLRFSLSRLTTEAEIEQTVSAIRSALRSLAVDFQAVYSNSEK